MEDNVAKYKAGFKGGPYFKDPVLTPRRPFVKAVTDANSAVRKETTVSKGTPMDPWNFRRVGK